MDLAYNSDLMDTSFPDQILEIIKKNGGHDFQIMKINSSGTIYGRTEYVNESVAFELLANKQQHGEISKQYPQLQPFLEMIRSMDTNPKQEKSLAFYKASKVELDQRESIVDSYRPFIRQSLSKNSNKITDIIWWEREIESIKTNAELAAFLKNHFEGIKLENDFVPQTALVFDLELDSKTNNFMRLMTDFIFNTDSPNEEDLPVAPIKNMVNNKIQSKLSSIKHKLKPLAFTLAKDTLLKKSGDLSKFSDALDFARMISQKREYVEIEKIEGELKFLQSSYKVHSYVMQAVVVALQKPKNYNKKFQKLIDATADGCHCGMNVEEILHSLNKWDKLYGAKLLSADFDRFELKFSRLPEDTDELCKEIWELCPNVLGEISGSAEFENMIKEAFVDNFKKIKTVTFWWK